MRSSSFACSLFALLTGAASAFTTCPGVTPGQSPVALQAHRLGDTSCDRVAFLKTSIAAVAAITTFSPAIAVAEDAVDDLAMPSAEEQKVSELHEVSVFLALVPVLSGKGNIKRAM
ncbi:hypothetical protein ACHAXR_011094 [Thalassiosira sp. AJA248-18]